MAGSASRAPVSASTRWAIVGWLTVLVGFGVGFIDTGANDVNCGSAFVASPVEGGALLSGNSAEDDVTRAVIHADCAQLVTRQRLIVGAMLLLGGACLVRTRQLGRSHAQRWNRA